MTVFSGKQVFPVDYEAEVSQRLLEASLSGDLKSALELIADPYIDVNFVGAVCLKSRKTEVIPCDESASQVRVEYNEFKTDVTALFLAVHSGNVSLVKKLLVTLSDSDSLSLKLEFFVFFFFLFKLFHSHCWFSVSETVFCVLKNIESFLF